MRRSRPVLRTALTSIGAAAVAVAVIAGWLGAASHRLHQQQARATAAAHGTVIADGLGDEGDIRVRWHDTAGREHTQRFGTYDTGRYRRGTTFDVTYDPARPDARALPTDPDETSSTDDLEVPILLAASLLALVVVIWALRGIRYRRRARQPASTAFGQALSGDRLGGPPINYGATPWVAIHRDPDGPAFAWQRVMWHPSLALARDVTPLTVHGDLDGRDAIVVDLPDGTALVPVGRLRHDEPRRYLLGPRRDTTLDDDLLLLPAGAVLPPAQPWWRRPAQFGAAGAFLGIVMALLLGAGPIGIPPFAAGAAAFLITVWALAGAEAA